MPTRTRYRNKEPIRGGGSPKTCDPAYSGSSYPRKRHTIVRWPQSSHLNDAGCRPGTMRRLEATMAGAHDADGRDSAGTFPGRTLSHVFLFQPTPILAMTPVEEYDSHTGGVIDASGETPDS